MISIVLKGHDYFYGISDIVRLFADEVREDRERGVVTGVCELEKTIVSELLGGKVYTYFEGTIRREDCVSCIYGEGTTEENGIRRAIKRSLYLILSELTGRDMPWGSLTGIRPTIVAREEDYDPEKLAGKYMVRGDKARLAVMTAREEDRILDSGSINKLNIYVGVPFCPSRCEYCSFISQDATSHIMRLSRYKDALIEEIRTVAPYIKSGISSVYIGGGTPTVFSSDDFGELIETVRDAFVGGKNVEFTVEAGRPDTITEEKMRYMAQAGVGRICINPQTMRDETLAALNRKHTSEDVTKCFHMAREYGIPQINMDLIAGLKYERAEDFLYSLNRVADMRPENITIHTLYKKRRAGMSRADVLDKANERGDIDEAVSEGYRLLMSLEYKPYYLYRQKDTGHGLENTGFALPGSECYYNVAMMSDCRNILSFGAGGMSKRIFDGGRLERCPCIKDVVGYIDKVREMAERKLAFMEGSDFV